MKKYIVFLMTTFLLFSFSVMGITQTNEIIERAQVVTLKGKPITLIGPELTVGDFAPDFQVVAQASLVDEEMKIMSLNDFAGKIKVISVTPSLDTPVCDLQIHNFNEEASTFPDDVAVINISMDLPFAIHRFCATSGIDKVIALSDYRFASFGTNWGILIKELRLLTRALFIVDKENVIQYIEIVPDTTQAPDYERALNALKQLIHNE
jgi:thiol peroxidase